MQGARGTEEPFGEGVPVNPAPCTFYHFAEELRVMMKPGLGIEQNPKRRSLCFLNCVNIGSKKGR